ncbi:polysaccharide biosynthesis/export family protein [Agrobacterium vitis]|uniref:Sugar ABC transporter substrate-binding protein n=1 Tax=Agrobacterium vitis TaxID=373 RepID=A0AAE4WKJ7_AGRVI|nr:polysaccharide biosynthesis/export family protein [Agrobacterium vitis]MCF1501772.1 sugar ABC transporter substrate-binding protein [Allorhizobium sp. Av2]MUZ60872.1 sugar ABC transporter substrate-binding protein [Agrobacterium vitis]MVA69177.1 sugar ABC transporter substrate-binding protein [Agrobacterium vitis]MVA90196.1 sugar ABC transporter substrate-binding protein [Agrobacterium vitis]
MKAYGFAGGFRSSKRITTLNVAALTLCLSLAVPGLTLADDYRLGVMDKVRVRVAEWQTAEGAVRDWAAVSGDYSVGAAGQVSLPFIGELPASGKTTAEVADEIGKKMQQLFGLSDRPSASVEISEYRPVYMAGAIQSPGEYPYAPGMTVLKALSVAGGLKRADAGQRFARDFLQAQGDGAVLVSQRNRLLVRRVRVLAEMNEKQTIEIPEELKSIPDINQLVESEAALMNSQTAKLKVQLSSLADLKTLLAAEIEALGKKSETQTRQLTMVQEDRDKVNSLSEQGLALSSRRLAVEQQVSDLQSALLDIDTNTLKAKQDLNKAQQDETTTRNDWDAQLAQELQDTEAELDQIALKLSTSRGLMAESLLQSSESASAKNADGEANVAYSIVREKDGKPTEIAVDENTSVAPGDVIKVTVKLSQPAMR